MRGEWVVLMVDWVNKTGFLLGFWFHGFFVIIPSTTFFHGDFSVFSRTLETVGLRQTLLMILLIFSDIFVSILAINVKQ